MSSRTRNLSLYFIAVVLQIFLKAFEIQGTPNITHHYFVPAAIIESSESLGNGCFKQTIREPDQSDLSRYISTEQLICPPGINMTAMTQLYQPNITHGPIASPVVPVYKPPAVMPIPVNATPIAVLPPPSVPAAPLPSVITIQKTQPEVFKPPQPVMAEIPNGAPSQVVVLSKRTGHYANDRKANSGKTLLDRKTYTIAALLAILSNCLI